MARPFDPHAKLDLLRAAEAVFVEHGLDRARVEEITARAGRSKGSFYLHFASKEEAFRQIVESIMARLASFIEVMDPRAVPPELTLPEIVDRWFEQEVELFEFLWQNRGVVRLAMQGGGSSSFGYLIDAFAERSCETTKAWLKLGIERGYYGADLDVEIASLVMSGAYDRVARALARLDRKPDIRAWVRGVQRVLLGGISSASSRDVFDQRVSESFESAPVSTASPSTRVESRVVKKRSPSNPRPKAGGARGL